MTYTPVQNRFWSDGWIRQLNALDRYLFLYLLTNGRAKLTGIYELPLDLMAAESGIDEKDLRLSMLQRLEPKIYYKEGWVIIVNYLTHRVSDSPKYLIGIKNEFNENPKKIQEIALSYGYPIHTLSIPNSISRNRIEENRRDISETSSLPVLRSKETSEDTERTKKPPKYPNARTVFSWFPHPQKSWQIDTTQLKHAELLFERGEKAVKGALSYVAKHQDEDFFYKINKPSDLERKWVDLTQHKS